MALGNPWEKKGYAQTSEELHYCGQEERMVLELLRVWRVWRTIRVSHRDVKGRLNDRCT